MPSKFAIPDCILRSLLFFFLLTIVFCLVPHQKSQGQDAIPKETLKSLKAATVYVRVATGRTEGSGSGFLIGKKNGYAYIVTNEHVVKKARAYHDRNVEVDFFSGTKERRSFKATVLSEDPSLDLAVLRIKDHEEIPERIPLKSKQEVRETQGVFILGFPFGEALATNRLGPNVTIGKGAISSLRTDDYGDLERVQVDGDINPGNSGGPIVFSDGTLMGVSVSTVLGTQIGMGIPGERVSSMLMGRVGSQGLSQNSQRSKLTTLSIGADLIDPLLKIKNVAFLYIEADKVSDDEMETPEDGRWDKISSKMKKVPLKIEGQMASAEKDFRGDYGEQIEIIHQITFENGTGKTFFTGPGTYKIRIAKRAKDNNVAAKEIAKRKRNREREQDKERERNKRNKETAPKDNSDKIAGKAPEKEEPIEGGWLGNSGGETKNGKKKSNIVPVKSSKSLLEGEFTCLDATCQRLNFDATKTVEHLVWDKESRHFFCLTSAGLLRKISFPELVEVSTIDFASKCSWMEMSKAGLCVLNSGLQDLVVVDPANLEVKLTLPAGQTSHFAASPATNSVFLKSGRGQLLQINAATGDHIRKYNTSDFSNPNQRIYEFNSPTLSPDGKYLLCEDSASLDCYRVKDNRLSLLQKSEPVARNARKIEISPDSKYVALPAGGGNGKGYTTYVFAINDLKKRVIEAEGGAYPQALAYDKKAGVLYGQNSEHELLTFNTNGLIQKSYDLVRNGTTLDLLVHPAGHKVVILAHPNIFVVNLPVE